MSMPRPQNAYVTPRVVSPETGDAILIEEVLAEIGGRASGAIEIVGDRGAGKTTVLECLAALMPPDSGVVLLDEPDPSRLAQAAASAMVIYTTREPRSVGKLQTFRLAPWGDDEVMEYLLAAHPQQCRSVVARLQHAPDRRTPAGNPELWCIVLDRMAADEAISGVTPALEKELQMRLPADLLNRPFADDWLRAASRVGRAEGEFTHLASLVAEPDLIRFLQHAAVQIVWASIRLARVIEERQAREWLAERLPRELVERAAVKLSPVALSALRLITEQDPPDLHAMAASILHAARCGWAPKGPLPLCLDGAYLAGADWAGIDLSGASLLEADLSASNLAEAKLSRAGAGRANFAGAVLRRADLREIQASGADFTGSDLSEVNGQRAVFGGTCLRGARLARAVLQDSYLSVADLSGASLRDADLSYARLAGAVITDADFCNTNLTAARLSGLRLREAIFSGARFADANLYASDLEGMELPDANFEGAYLIEACLTGSRIPRGCFHKADLRGAAMADVQWEQADLREADLRGCVFHMGSSRSGLVGSPLASEGTRTGFYTDEYDQQNFRPPEEIRKANLRGADLRGANVSETDFYLVDLRDAKYDPDQLEHFRRCGAILFDPARE